MTCRPFLDRMYREMLDLPQEVDRYQGKPPRLRIDRYMERPDQRVFARLIEKYGWDTLVYARGLLPAKKSRGRQSDPHAPYRKALDAAWIEKAIERHKLAGHAAPIKEARTDYFYYRQHGAVPGHERKGRPPTENDFKTIRKRHSEGKLELNRLLARAKPNPRK